MNGEKKTALTTPKNGKGRVIKPAPSVMDVLKDEQTNQLGRRLKAGRAWDNKMNLVFTDAIGGYINWRSVYGQFKKIAKQIGAPRARFHDLRHSYAVLAIKSGDDIMSVSKNLGHYSAAFTMDIYGYVTVQMQEDSSSRMERMIGTLKWA